MKLTLLSIIISITLTNGLPKYEILINRIVKRTINVEKSQFALIIYEIEFENVSKQNVSVYKFELEPNVKNYRFQAYKVVNKETIELHYHKISHRYKNYSSNYLQINLLTPLKHGETDIIQANIIHFLAAKPYREDEEVPHKNYIQLVYPGNKYFYSPYHTVMQHTVIQYQRKLHQINRFEYAEFHWGPFNYIERNSYDPLNFEFVSTGPLIIIKQLVREIDASSIFGKVKITDTVELKNLGVPMKKFSLYPDDWNPVKDFMTYIPGNSTNVKLYDRLGYIHFKVNYSNKVNNYLALRLFLRYPLFGGWKISYTLSYCIPSTDVLYQENDHFTLTMPVLGGMDTNEVVMSLKTKIILPPNARNISAGVIENSAVTKSFKRLRDGKTKSLLFLPSRTIIQYFGTRVVSTDVTNFQIRYYSDLRLWEIGFNISFGFAAFFLIVTLLHRLYDDVDIDRKNDFDDCEYYTCEEIMNCETIQNKELIHYES